jgi:hypothetical protein
MPEVTREKWGAVWAPILGLFTEFNSACIDSMVYTKI